MSAYWDQFEYEEIADMYGIQEEDVKECTDQDNTPQDQIISDDLYMISQWMF